MTRVNKSSGLRRFIERHQSVVGFALAGLVLMTLAFDYFVGFGGPHLIGLRLVYLVLMSLLVGYVYTLSTMQDRR
jgi:hypothetical protein